jgi:DnaJ-domain-containing protein 1
MAATILRRVGLEEPARSRTLNLRENLTKLLCALAISAALSGPAIAEEQLVMPFACHVAGGQVRVAPSAPQTYQIYGHREQKRMTTCSPYNPRKCHNWSVHRFDLDCGGARTSWQSVVAALSPILAESLGPFDDAAYPPPGGARPYRRGPGPKIAFPRGFAPNPMNVARFEQTAPVTADVPVPPKKPELTQPELTESPQVAALEPSSEPAAAPSSTEDSDDKPEAASKTAPAEQETAEVAEHRALKVEVVSGSGETEVVSGSGETTGSLPTSRTTSNTLWPSTSQVFTLTLALLFALTATLFLGRRRMLALPMPMPVARLRGPAGLPVFSMLVSARETATARRQEDVSGSRLRLWDETWLPRTMIEALDVLGVEPNASSDKIKSTVTRLRRALHPDHAFDEEDRLLRERRLKQINVAWEIVSKKRRRAPWLKAEPRS